MKVYTYNSKERPKSGVIYVAYCEELEPMCATYRDHPVQGDQLWLPQSIRSRALQWKDKPDILLVEIPQTLEEAKALFMCGE